MRWRNSCVMSFLAGRFGVYCLKYYFTSYLCAIMYSALCDLLKTLVHCDIYRMSDTFDTKSGHAAANKTSNFNR